MLIPHILDIAGIGASRYLLPREPVFSRMGPEGFEPSTVGFLTGIGCGGWWEECGSERTSNPIPVMSPILHRTKLRSRYDWEKGKVVGADLLLRNQDDLVGFDLGEILPGGRVDGNPAPETHHALRVERLRVLEVHETEPIRHDSQLGKGRKFGSAENAVARNERNVAVAVGLERHLNRLEFSLLSAHGLVLHRLDGAVVGAIRNGSLVRHSKLYHLYISFVLLGIPPHGVGN